MPSRGKGIFEIICLPSAHTAIPQSSLPKEFLFLCKAYVRNTHPILLFLFRMNKSFTFYKIHSHLMKLLLQSIEEQYNYYYKMPVLHVMLLHFMQ